MKIKKIEIDSFRLFDGENISFQNGHIDKSANLVAIHAPNGFGKTSLFDAIEFCVTKNIQRLKISNFNENVKSDKQENDYSSFIHNKQTPEKNVHIRITYENGTVEDREVQPGDELKLLKGEAENGYFSEVILSQDWFNQFLATTDAAMRFEIFTRNFKDTRGLLQYYEQLRTVHNIITKRCGKKRTDLKNEKKRLVADVDNQIVVRLGEIIEELQILGIVIPWNNKLDERVLQQQHVNCDQKQYEISAEHKKVTDIVENIEKLSGGYEGLIKPEELGKFVEKQKSLLDELEKLNNRQKKVAQLKAVLKAIDEYTKSLAQLSAANIEFEYLIKGYQQYKAVCDALSLLEKQVRDLGAEKLSEEGKLSQKKQEGEALEKQSSTQIKTWEEWKTKQSQLSEDYIAYQQLKKEQEKLQGEDQEKRQSLDQLHHQKADEERIKQHFTDLLHAIRMPGLISEVFDFDEEIKKMNDLTRSIQGKEEQIEKLAKAIEKQSQYLSQVNALVVRAREMTDTLKTGTCPLCGHNYGDVEILLKSIEENASVSESLNAFIKKKSVLEELVEKEKNERQALLSKTEEAINLKIRKNLESIAKIEKEVGELNKALFASELRQKSIQTQISQNYTLFEGLTEEQIRNLYAEKVAQSEAAVNDAKKKTEDLRKEIETLGKKCETLSKQINEAKNAILEKEKEPDFAAYKKKLEERDEKAVSLDYWQHALEENKKHKVDFLEKLEAAKKDYTALEDDNVMLAEEEGNANQITLLSKEKSELDARLLNTIRFIKESCGVGDFDAEANPDGIKEKVDEVREKMGKTLSELDSKAKLMGTFRNHLDMADKYAEQLKIEKKIKDIEAEITGMSKQMEEIDTETASLKKYLEDFVDSFFQKELINKLYNTIDPHPTYKTVEFRCDFDQKHPKLFVIMSSKADGNDKIVPNLYLSTAQINILSFCIFMAKAMFAKADDGKSVDCLFVDDPIQALDDINILSMIDLLRNIAFTLNKQIVITTHDKNFFGLLQKKMPQDKFNACYLEIYERGKFKRVEA